MTGNAMPGTRNKARDLQGFRSMLELAVCFVITVCVLRGFFLEGYLVSTGSMAPVLLGFHKQIECPSCQYSFACGVRFDESTDNNTVQSYASCPNCGQINIDIDPVPRNHGDQLLVHKNVFDFRRPRRWEPVVFRNPDDPGEAYVKRVVGLPRERLLIRDGDIYVNGRIARKDLTAQRSMRILVSDLEHVPDDDNWELPWHLEGNWTTDEGALISTGHDPAASNTLSFRNWRWFGGNHTVETPLLSQDAYPDWNDFIQRYDRIPVLWTSRLDYDSDAQVLRCHGVMSDDMQQDLMSSATNEEFRRAIYRLAALSHLSPVTDRYGYNSVVASPEHHVSDLMLVATIDVFEHPQSLQVSIPVAADTYILRLDVAAGHLDLREEGSTESLRSATTDLSDGRFTLEVSNFDRRILVAINGKLAFGPLDLPGLSPDEHQGNAAKTAANSDPSIAEQMRLRQRFQISIEGGHVSVSQLQMYRDVYYTPGRRKHAVDSACEIAANSYFVHGDNSPVSSDSRSWENPFVPHHLLVGKPFIVHLPSRPGRLRLGNREISIRIPEFRRIRYIQ